MNPSSLGQLQFPDLCLPPFISIVTRTPNTVSGQLPGRFHPPVSLPQCNQASPAVPSFHLGSWYQVIPQMCTGLVKNVCLLLRLLSMTDLSEAHCIPLPTPPISSWKCLSSECRDGLQPFKNC